jgi:hypothetical protein
MLLLLCFRLHRGRIDRELVRLLLDNGANPNAKDCDLDDAFYAASRAGELEVVEMLLQKGYRSLSYWAPHPYEMEAAGVLGDYFPLTIVPRSKIHLSINLEVTTDTRIQQILRNQQTLRGHRFSGVDVGPVVVMVRVDVLYLVRGERHCCRPVRTISFSSASFLIHLKVRGGIQFPVIMRVVPGHSYPILDSWR